MSLADAFTATYDPDIPLNAVKVLEDEFHRDVRRVGEGLEFDFSTGKYDEASATYQTAKMIDDMDGLKDRVFPLNRRKSRSYFLAGDWAEALEDNIESELDEPSGKIRFYGDGVKRDLEEGSVNQVYHHAIEHFEDVGVLSDEFIERVSPNYAKK